MILHAAWVAPVGQPPIRDGFVSIRDGRIAAVSSKPPAGDSVQDLGNVALLPGLINPHTHLELTAYRDRIPPGPFWTWVAELVRLRREPDAATGETAGIRHAAAASLRAGVTTVGDISRCGTSWRTLADTPLRAVCFAELLTLAADPPRNPAELVEACDAVSAPRLAPGISPHAPYTVAPAGLAEAVRVAGARGWPWTLHLAETPEEIAFLAGNPAALPPPLAEMASAAGIAPVPGTVSDYIDRYLADASPGALVHLNYVTNDDIRELAERGHTVVFCPLAHRYFGHPPHPLPALLAAGVRVALGTDSAASGATLSPLDEARLVRETWPDLLSPTRLFEMITIDAARALGQANRLGAIAPGMHADLAAFALPPDTHDPLAAVLDHATHAEAVWIDGSRIL